MVGRVRKNTMPAFSLAADEELGPAPLSLARETKLRGGGVTSSSIRREVSGGRASLK